MSFEAMLATQRLTVRMSHACFRVLMTIAEHADKAGRNCWASIDTIAAEAQTDEKTVRRSLATLQQQGLIAGERGRGRGKTTVWALTFPIQPIGIEGATPGYQGHEEPEKEGLTPGIISQKEGLMPSFTPGKEGVAPGITTGKEGVRPGFPELKEGVAPVKEGLTPVKEGVAPPEPVLNQYRTIESLSTPKPKSENQPAEMVAIWNAICGDVLPKAQAAIPDSRRVALLARLASEMGGSLDAWQRFCRKVRAAPHLIGENDRGWHANLDWCLKPANTAKVLEGNYDRASAGARRQPGQLYPGGL